MPSKISRKNNYLVDRNGSPLRGLYSDNDKHYAVIVKCGHCGDGYYIPMMLTEKCKDVESAIESVKLTPRVKRDQKNVILDAFEISEFERFAIDAINDHDPYLRGFYRENDMETIERRVVQEFLFESKDPKQRNSKYDDITIKTSDEYHDYYVLERCFAPRIQGSDIIFPRRINRRELLDEFFKQNCKRYGVKKGDPFFLSIYYQMFGKGNDLNIQLYGNSFYYTDSGKVRNCEIPEELLRKIEERGPVFNESSENHNETDSMATTTFTRKSAKDRFEARMNKFKEIQQKKNGSSWSEESEPGK